MIENFDAVSGQYVTFLRFTGDIVIAISHTHQDAVPDQQAEKSKNAQRPFAFRKRECATSEEHQSCEACPKQGLREPLIYIVGL